LVPDLDMAHAGITGTSDAWPYKDQIALIREILPHAETLGVLFNPGEAASQYGIKEIRKHAAVLGFELIEGLVNAVGDVRPVTENLSPRVDALFLSSDNTVIGGVAGALKTALSDKKPLFVGDSGTVAKGGLAAVSVGYYQLGRQTGDLVARILGGETNLRPVVARGSELHVNTKAAELMGVKLPAAVLSRATKIYDGIAQ
jgi:putative ABC transport system substrate-binding protein